MTETAQANDRVKMTEADRRNYSGVVRHPMARRWMLQRLTEAQEQAEAAEDETTRERFRLEVERVRRELKRNGVNLEER